VRSPSDPTVHVLVLNIKVHRQSVYEPFLTVGLAKYSVSHGNRALGKTARTCRRLLAQGLFANLDARRVVWNVLVLVGAQQTHVLEGAQRRQLAQFKETGVFDVCLVAH